MPAKQELQVLDGDWAPSEKTDEEERIKKSVDAGFEQQEKAQEEKDDPVFFQQHVNDGKEMFHEDNVDDNRVVQSGDVERAIRDTPEWNR